MSAIDLDALGLLATQKRSTVSLGAVEVGFALKDGNVANSIGKLPDADLVIDLNDVVAPPDYFAELTVINEEGGQRVPRFSGSVVSASPSNDGVAVKALSGVSLLETPIGDFVTRGLPSVEHIYVLTRTGGFSDQQLDIEGIEKLPRETFEIVAPVNGVRFDHAIDIDGVRFVQPEVAASALAGLDVDETLRSDFEAPGYAVVYVTAVRTLAAEEEGLGRIDLALAWLTSRLRYGLATLPDGSPLPFERSESLASVTRRDLVAVRGMSTLRQWLRRPAEGAVARSVALSPTNARLQSSMPPMTLQERLALLAFGRAARETDFLARVHALFESIEFYASGVTVPALFTKEERRQVRANLPPSLSKLQRERIDNLVADLNNAPLRLRLMQALDDDHVPIDANEVDLLWRLRALRNDVVHGRRSELPTAEDLEYATSIVARMLVYRTATKRQSVPYSSSR